MQTSQPTSKGRISAQCKLQGSREALRETARETQKPERAPATGLAPKEDSADKGYVNPVTKGWTDYRAPPAMS